MKTTLRTPLERGTKGSVVHGADRPVRQMVLVLRRGGALGAYQAGVHHALSESGIEPDRAIGTSIAGNEAAPRCGRVQDFWS
jgi:NTE family protein